MIYKIQQKACKITPMDLHMTFDFVIYKLETNKGIKTQKSLKTLTNTQNILKTS